MPKRAYSRAYVSVRFKGADLDPLTVTEALQLPPDHQHRDGEPRLSGSAKGRVTRYADHEGGRWSMSSKGWVESPRLETHLEWLLSQLEARETAIRELLSSGVDVDFFCYSVGSPDEPPSLPRTIRGRAEALVIRIQIDHYTEG